MGHAVCPSGAAHARAQPPQPQPPRRCSKVGPKRCPTLHYDSSPGCRACRYEAAAFFADKLVTLSGYAPAEVYTLAQVRGAFTTCLQQAFTRAYLQPYHLP